MRNWKLEIGNWNFRASRGVMALPSIIVISLLVLIAGIGVASTGFFESIMSYGEADAKKALFIAEAGAEDAFQRVVRDKLCNEGGVPSCSSYTLAIGEGSASIAVSGSGTKTIVSEGTVKGKRRKVQVVVSFDSSYKATQTSWQEITN